MTEAHTLPINCPICNEHTGKDLKVHLMGAHTHEEVVDELLGYMEADEEELY